MADPLAQLVDLLQPSVSHTKLVGYAGAWLLRRQDVHRPFYCAALEGAARFCIDGQPDVVLDAGDFLLVPMARSFVCCSLGNEKAAADSQPVEVGPGEYRVGALAGEASVRHVVGYGEFGSDDARLLVSLLPAVVHVRANALLTRLSQLLDQEARAGRGVRELVLSRLLGVLIMEALRACGHGSATPGLLSGLADERLAVAIRLMHERPGHPWTVMDLAEEAALSRSLFFSRFQAAMGMTPIEYLTQLRMLLAKDALRQGSEGVATLARTLGYSSASTFSVAFSRHVGVAPMVYAQAARAATVDIG